MKLLQNCAKLNRQKYHFEGTTMDSQILHIFYHDIYWSRIVLNDKQYSKGIKDYEVNLDKFINEINKRQYLKDLFNDYDVADMSYNGALMAEHALLSRYAVLESLTKNNYSY